MRDLDPSVFNRAVAVFHEFGPERGRPVEVRWRERVPELDPADYAAVAARSREIQARATALGGRCFAGEISRGEIFDTLAREFPELTRAMVSRIGSQGFYFAMR